MKILTEAEVLRELIQLDSSNGWGADYKPDVIVTRDSIIKGIITLIEKHGSFPVGVSKNDEFWFLIVKEGSGKYSLSETWEASMLNYKIDTQSGESLDKYAERVAGTMFFKHINKIKVVENLNA